MIFFCLASLYVRVCGVESIDLYCSLGLLRYRFDARSIVRLIPVALVASLGLGLHLRLPSFVPLRVVCCCDGLGLPVVVTELEHREALLHRVNEGVLDLLCSGSPRSRRKSSRPKSSPDLPSMIPDFGGQTTTHHPSVKMFHISHPYIFAQCRPCTTSRAACGHQIG